MAINRAPYDLLIDDSGLNADGTPWNKQQIKDVLLDPIDALVGVQWIDIPHTAAMYTANAGTWTVTGGARTFCYCVIGAGLGQRIAFYILDIATDSTISTACSWLYLTLPATAPLPDRWAGGPVSYWWTTGAGTGIVDARSWVAGNQIGIIRDIGGSPWAAGTSQLYIRSCWFFPF